jgi:hypothetical protein
MTKTVAHEEPSEAVHVRGRGDLIDVAPYLLGFHPVDSVVVIALPADGNKVCLTIRADIADVRQDAFVDYLAALVAQGGGRRVVLVVYGGAGGRPPGELPDKDVVALFADAADVVRLEVLGAMYVAGGRWWSYDPCGAARCCPPAGGAVGGSASTVASEAERAGLTALPDRAALAATLAPVADEEEQHAMSAALAAAERDMVAAAEADGGIGSWRAEAVARLRAVLQRIAGGEVPWLDPAAAASLLVAFTDTLVRDLAWSWTNDSPSRCAPAGELWRQLARRAPEPYDTAPLFLAAWAAWRGGGGALARIALERALASDPEYIPALLLESAISQSLDPGTLGPLLGRCPIDPVATSQSRRRRRVRSAPGEAAGGAAAGGAATAAPG